MKIPLFGDSMSMDTTSIKDTTTTTTSSADIQRNQSKQCPPFVPLLFSTPTATTTKTANAANLLDVLSCHQENVALSWQELVSSNNNNNLLIIMPVIMAVLLSLMTVFFTILCIGRRYLHRHRHHPKRGNYTSTKPRRQIKRTVSFTSSMMAAKVIAPHANLPEPVINAVVLFETCPTPNDVLQLVVKKMLEYERLSQIPTIDTNHKNGEQLSFQPGTNYDPAKLIRTMQVKDKDDSELYKMIENHIHDPLNDTQGRGRLPWWEILVIENKGSGHSACVCRIHHALGDGISLATVAEHILQFADGSPMTSVIPQGLMEKRSNDHHTKMPWYSLAWKLWLANLEVIRMPLIKPDHPTVFSKHTANYSKMTHTHRRKAVLFPTLPLDFVKDVKNAAGVSVNDVLFTCLSQAIHDYLQQQECPVLKQQQSHLLCRALIAAVLPRTVHDAAVETLQNKWFMLSSDLGIGSSRNNDILERLQYIHKHLSSLKTSPIPLVGLAHQNYIMPYLPRALNEQMTYNIFVRRSMSISNVPGPTKTCLFANQPARGVHMFLSNIIPHVAFISYAGQIFGNMTLDPEAIPDAQSLSRHFGRAVATLARRLKIEESKIPKDLVVVVEGQAAP